MKSRLIRFFPLAVLFILILFILDIISGSVYIPFQQIIRFLFRKPVLDSVYYTIIWHFRLPKAITALFAGAALSVCGLQMQTLFRNPLAGPFVLGINAGASLAVALVIMSGAFSFLAVFQSIGIVLAACVGACSMLLIILLLAGKLRDNSSLLLVGVMIGHLTAAVEGVLQYFSKAENLQGFVIWSLGSFSNVVWDKLILVVPVLSAAIIIAFLNSKTLNALMLGDRYAQSLGVNLNRSRFIIILSTGVLAGTITAFCGPIAFLGMAVPHLARGLIKTSDHRILIPATALTGAALALFCDIISQTLITDTVLPVNAITSLIGAPVVIAVILKRKHLKA